MCFNCQCISRVVDLNPFELRALLMCPSKWKSLTFILLMIKIWNSNTTDVTEAENTNLNLYHYCALTLTLRNINLLSVNTKRKIWVILLTGQNISVELWTSFPIFLFFQFQSYIALSLRVLEFSAINQDYYNSIVSAPITKFLEVIE